MAPRRRLSSPLARWLLGTMVVATCVLAGALGAGAVAAAGVQPGDAQHRTAGIARAAERGITGELVGALTKAIRAAGGK